MATEPAEFRYVDMHSHLNLYYFRARAS